MASRQNFTRLVRVEIAKRAMRPNGRTCIVGGCDEPHCARGFCNTHYYRWRRNGSPTEGARKNVKKGVRKAFVEKAKSHKGDDCLIWPFSHNGNGYGIFRLNGRNAYAHRIVCESVNGPQPFEGAQAAHSCGNGKKGCVAPAHLRWDTAKGNAADTVAMGRTQRGERSPRARLTESQARYALKMRGVKSCRSLGEELGVAPQTIGAVWAGDNWAWLK